MKVTLPCLLMMIGLLPLSSNANPHEFLSDSPIYKIENNERYAQCIRNNVNAYISNTNIVISRISAGGIFEVIESINSDIIQALATFTRGTKVNVYDAYSNVDFELQNLDSFYAITATVSGFETGGKIEGEGIGVSSKYVSMGKGKALDKTLQQMNFHIETKSGGVFDAFSLANIINHIDTAVDSEVSKSSFGIYLDFSNYKSESIALARKALIYHASAMILELIVDKKFHCTYDSNRSYRYTNVAKKDTTNSIEIIEVANNFLPDKKKKYYFPRKNAKTLRCKNYKCSFKFTRKPDENMAYYLEDSLLNSFPEDNIVYVDCKTSESNLVCEASGQLNGFSQSKLKKLLFYN